jgi:putative protease
VGGVRFVCLPPVMFQEEETLSKIEAEIDAHPDEQFMVGLNNVAHMEVALQWNSKKHVTYFIDYGLYAANLETLLFFIQHIERLQGAYLWLEATERQRNDLENAVLNHVEKMPIGLRFINEKERFPMFISRICFHRSFQKEQACPNKCPKRYVYHLKQNQRAVEVRVIDCISYVHLVRPARPLPTGQ